MAADSPTAPASVGSPEPFVATDADDAELAIIEAARGYIRDAIHVTDTPGFALAVAVHGRMLWEEGFGFADLALKRPMSSDCTWRVGSFSKTYVATAIMQLVERGIIELHAPARRYVPELDVINPLGSREVTVYDLLTFQSGLATGTADQRLAPAASLAEHLASGYRSQARPEYHLDRPAWTARVGERYQYSNFGIATVGYIVERTNPEGLTFADYVQGRIARPLGLRSSGFAATATKSDLPPDLLTRLCTGYARFGSVQIPTPFLYSADGPAASLLTTPGDHATLLLSFLDDADAGGEALVGASSRRMMLSPQARMSEMANGEDWWNGIGFEMQAPASSRFNFGHAGGYVFGWYSNCAAYPALGLVIVACSNCWDLTRYFQPATDIVPGLVTEFLWQRFAAQRAPSAVLDRTRPWGWRASYAMGFMLIERINGLLGVSAPVEQQAVEAMISGARDLGCARADGFDAEGFRAGAQAAAGIELTPAEVRALLDSHTAAISTDDLRLLGLWFSRKGRLGLPLGFYADPR